MSYPPPDADLYALNGYKFFRLNTALTSDGDIYESAQGATGFSIGPDSDISKVNIAYFDDQLANNFMNQVAISPGRPFPGLIASRNEAVYMPSGRRGRTLIWSDELYNPTWSPDFVDIAGRVDYEVPVLDVVQYFAPSGLQMNEGRNDKEYWYDFLNAPPSDSAPNVWIVVIPFYGRRFFSMNFSCDATVQAANIDVSIYGLHYKPGTNNTAAATFPLVSDSPAPAGYPIVTVAPGESYNCVYTASQKSTGGASWIQGNNPAVATLQSSAGMFDALAIQFSTDAVGGIDSAAQNLVRIRTSDREA